MGKRGMVGMGMYFFRPVLSAISLRSPFLCFCSHSTPVAIVAIWLSNRKGCDRVKDATAMMLCLG